MRDYKQKSLVALLIGASLAILVSLFAWGGTFSLWQAKLSDMLQPGQEISDDIVIVAVDDDTIDEQEGLGNFSAWSRDNYAKVFENIGQYDPKMIGLDFYLKSPRKPSGDEAFRDALMEAPNPVIFYRMNAVYDPAGYYVQEEGAERNLLPLEIFRTVPTVTTATSKVFKDGDDVIRRIMPFILDRSTGEYYENFAFAIARIALNAGEKSEAPAISSNTYSLTLENGEKLDIPLEEGQMLINYATIPLYNTHTTISFLDVYKEDYSHFRDNPEALFKDKIVLIGPRSIEIEELRDIPTSKGVKTTGIEIHANVLQTILNQAFLRTMTLPEQILLIAFFAILSAFVFMFTRIRWSLVYLVATPLAYSALSPLLFSRGLIMDLIHPYITFVTVFMAAYMYRYLTEFKSKMALKSAFSKYVNPSIAEKISEDPDSVRLGGSKQQITVIFTDIAHFTTISEQLTPESLVALLNEYLEAMSGVIMAEGGTVDKYEGDAIMAFFGAPIAQDDHPLRACKTALQMRHRMAELHKKWEQDPPLPGGEKKPMIDFRCGISSGEAIVGNIGSSERVEYTAMGDIVNLGSRLEGANKKYSTNIMMSEETYNVVKDSVEARELDTIRVVGKKQPIKVFELLNLKGQLVPEAEKLLALYAEGVELYHSRKFAEGLVKFDEILKVFPEDGPSKLYRQRCEVLRDFPPKDDWDGVFEMGSK